MRNYTFRYDQHQILSEAAAGGGAFQVFSPCSLYDPDNTGVGHQPMYFDQLVTSTGPYTRYRALHTVAELIFNSNSTSPCTVIAYVSPTGATPSSMIQAMEKPWRVMAQLAPAGSAPTIARLKLTIPHPRALGISRQHLMTDDYYAGSYNASPALNCYIVACVYSQGGTIGYASLVTTLTIQAEVYSLTNTGTS
jgi:hypothetical protein